MERIESAGEWGWPIVMRGRLPGEGTGTISDERTGTRDDEDEGDYAGIRCPLCGWTPNASSRWYCFWSGTGPEPRFDACGTCWNTFDTRGRCPGCAHQWIWTTCLRCGIESRHEDWYERGREDR